jgi:hypothetical protein
MCRLRMVKPSTHSRSRSTGRRFFSAGSLQETPLLLTVSMSVPSLFW